MLSDVFLASIFLAYMESKLFFAFARENSPVQVLTAMNVILAIIANGRRAIVVIYREA